MTLQANAQRDCSPKDMSEFGLWKDYKLCCLRGGFFSIMTPHCLAQYFELNRSQVNNLSISIKQRTATCVGAVQYSMSALSVATLSEPSRMVLRRVK